LEARVSSPNRNQTVDLADGCLHCIAQSLAFTRQRRGGANMETNHPTWAALLERAVNEPGTISSAYQQFHHFSLGNQLLCLTQCLARQIQPGPIATFPKWQSLNRHVKRGEKAITLCQPVTIKKRSEAMPEQEEETIVRFVYRNAWFVMSQTEGQDIAPLQVPSWSKERALANLKIEEIPFDEIDGNVQGFARQRQIAINPVAALPHKTLFHECGHILLQHTEAGEEREIADMPRSLKEAEAECVAMLVCEALGLPGAAESRAYVQHWWGQGNPIPEKSAMRILRVADQILRAGREENEREVLS
jgi:antirestriction protein ArdC